MLTHLHVHSHYTLLGATPTIPALVQTAAAQGMTALALTDTNVLYGAVAFAQACTRAGIQPVLGMVVTVVPPEARAPGMPQSADELVLLARNGQGWRSLCGLSSAIQAHPQRETLAQQGVDWETLRKHCEVLVCLAGGRRSWIERAIRRGHAAGAARYASRLGGLYGEHACLAIEIHKADDQPVAATVSEIGKRFGLPVAAVQPVYALQPDARARLRLLCALARNCRLEAVEAGWLPDAGDEQAHLHWQTPAEMRARYASFPAALTTIGEIVSRCDVALPDGKPIWPVLALPAEKTHDQALHDLARAGMHEHYAAVTPAVKSIVEARLVHELGAITRRGIAPLFLLVADITRFARSREIPFNTRGSVANSLVAYCTGITTVDPVAHDLLFERFLNPERVSLPDIDLDFCSHRRDEVLHYVRERYGAERVAMVATMNTLRPKGAVRETAKAYGLDDAQVEELAGLARDQWHPDPRRRQRDPLEEILEELNDPHLRLVMQTAYSIVGVPHHLSIHPGGVVVAPETITAIAPVQWTPKGFWVTQFSHEDVAALGLPKIDLLGIRALTVVADTVEMIRIHHDPHFRLSAIPLDDPATGDMLARGDTVAVFQCESTGAQRTLRQLQARSVRDLAVANAFFKPGPATGGMAQAFIRRYRGEEVASYLHPALEPILAPTQGVLLFQEQILRVAREVAGLSWGEADRLRRGMSKFQAQEMAAMQARFVAGCELPAPDGPGMTPSQAQTLWGQVMAFAGYGFNQGHATAYADLSYRSAYLRAHWPAEFLCARLADGGGFHHQAIYLAEARRLGIDVRPPHVNHSFATFSLSYHGRGRQALLWMGLGQVRDLRRATLHGIIAAREADGPFRSIDDLLARVPMGRKEWTHLIQCGALDGLDESRAALLDGALHAQGQDAQQMAFDFVAVRAVTAESATQRLQWEQRLLGLPVSLHPLAATPVAQRPPLRVGELESHQGRTIQSAGVRLPGWTGGKGWYLGDEQSYVVAIPVKGLANPRPWRPVTVAGRWCHDEWGNGWLQVESWTLLEDS